MTVNMLQENIFVITQQPFNILLDSNPTTGYQWKLIWYPPFVRLINEIYIPDFHPQGMVGTGGKQVFTLIADYAGEGLLVFDYSTPWGEHGKQYTVCVIARNYYF
jgi:predicted secreted protein